MWIRDVNVPSELIDAARAGHLVIFVGAGASRDAPAALPDFRSLIEEIGALVGSPPSEDDVRRPDVYLGRLADKGLDVHRLVRNAINKPDSEPNGLHKAIVSLASAHPSPRIVTTNYDLHLMTAAVAEGLSLPVYEGPALPIGDDFEGIVHLHGSLEQDARRLVVTDKDFGRAYLLEAWAARFLERMFSAFTVLFVGYSHGDVVMQYLARSLGSSGKRFVCTSDGDDPAWRRYGLTPVPYAVVDGSHAALPTFMARWSELTAMGQTQHRAQIAVLVAGEPPTIPEEISYLDEVLDHPERIRYFVEKARGLNWFVWVAERPAFQRLFDRDRARTEPARILMSWVGDNYILDESTSSLTLLAMRERPWPSDTWQTVVHRLFAYNGDMGPLLSQWLLLALQNAPGSQDELLDMLLAEANWGNNLHAALTLFEDRTRPVLKSAISFGDTDTARFDVDLPGDEFWLSKAWSKVFVPMLNEHLAPIMASVEEQITRVYRTLRSLNSEFDSISFRRSAIEPHEQDSFRDPISVLIDAARDCIEYALTHDIARADRRIEDWITRKEALFQRLAVHSWTVRADRSADEKLQWLHARNWLWELPLQHEIYLLLQDALPAASDAIVQAFVDAATAGPPADEESEASPYRSYNLLAWLAQTVPDRITVFQVFAEYQAAHPEFAPRERPDLNTYLITGTVEDALPFSADELHARIAENPATGIAELREFQTDSFTFTGPTWTGALRSLQACVSAHPADGLVVADALRSADGELRNAIIHGWDTADLDEQTLVDLLAVIEGWDRDEIGNAAARMLSNGGIQTNPTPWHRYPGARVSASNLWPTEPVTGVISSGDDLVMDTINHPAGDLAKFWTKVVQWEWTQAGDTWDGLTDELTAELDRMVCADDRNGLLAGSFLASQLHFYFAADPTWAMSRLLPLFDWNGNEERARGAWQGFLTWGRPNDGLLSAGLLDAYVETCSHQDALGSRLSHELGTHLASIALQVGQDPAQWLPHFVLASPEELRVWWAEQVGSFVEELGPDEAGAQWEHWMRAYWSGRIQSTPLPLASAEASAMARWLIGLPTVRAEAVTLLIQTPAALPQRFLHQVHDLDLTSDAAHWATAITHLLRGTAGPSGFFGHYLKDVVQQLRAADPAPNLSQLIDEALRLGVLDAPDW